MEFMYFDLGFLPHYHNIGNKVIKVGCKSFDIISCIFIYETDTLVSSGRSYLISFNHENIYIYRSTRG